MKKISFLLVAILFIAFAFFGFKAMAKISKENTSSPPEQDDMQFIGEQENYLLIHVTDLSVGSPQLISIWGAFVVFTSPPQILFIPLFPADDDESNQSFLSNYEMDQVGNINTRFLDQLEEAYDIQTDGYLLVDNHGLSLFHKWANTDLKVMEITPQNDAENRALLSAEKIFFNALCKEFSSGGAKPLLNRIRWVDLIPGHFFTNLSFETLTLAQDFLKTAGKIESCQVLYNE